MHAIPRIAIVSDIHYASAAEQARGSDYDIRHIANPRARSLLQLYRRYLWLREPFKKNYLVDDFLSRVDASFLVANGDFTCDSGFIGVADDAAMQSVSECLARLRSVFGGNMAATWGDHDLGKKDFYGLIGGMRLASAQRLANELDLPAFWSRDFDGLVLAGIASSLVGFEALESETLPEERKGWHRLREDHMRHIRALFSGLEPDQKLVLFCHDPTALPYLLREEVVCRKLNQVERTIIGHLHSEFILKQSRVMAGMPEISFLGHTVRKLSRALARAKTWKPFKVALCPSLAGMELFKDGGYGILEMSNNAPSAFNYRVQRLPRRAHRAVHQS